jgi:iron(III) transport system ATP-binding protein
MPPIHLLRVTKRFGATVAIDGVTLDVADGELFFLLGPSGCGKTTLLRMIAGFIEPTEGTIRFGDRDVTAEPPARRNAGMVFQSYALWPHMTVAENVAYGLDVRRVAAAERRQRVESVLRTVRMEALAQRRPPQLSGGQQQRVALARALVVAPDVLLLDEPLSNLDAKLRLEMRGEIVRICREARITAVYVTHDQKEALAMADRIAVLADGRVAQVGTPRALYERPESRFVAEFLGETSFVPATVRGRDGGVIVLDTPAGVVRSDAAAAPAVRTGDRVLCSIRPEALAIGAAADRVNRLAGARLATTYLGEAAQHVVDIGGGCTVKVLEMNPGPPGPPGERVELSVLPERVVVVEKGPGPQVSLH